MKEIWRPIEFTNGVYSVSSFGRIRYEINKTGSFKGRIKSPCYRKDYAIVALCFNKIRKTVSIHRLVMEAFIGKAKEGFEVNHKDFNKKNNILSNLEYVTHKYNISHAKINGRMKSLKGEKCGKSKLKNEDILTIRNKYRKGVNQSNRGYPASKLAKEFNVHKDTILQIVKNKTWQHI